MAVLYSVGRPARWLCSTGKPIANTIHQGRGKVLLGRSPASLACEVVVSLYRSGMIFGKLWSKDSRTPNNRSQTEGSQLLWWMARLEWQSQGPYPQKSMEIVNGPQPLFNLYQQRKSAGIYGNDFFTKRFFRHIHRKTIHRGAGRGRGGRTPNILRIVGKEVRSDNECYKLKTLWWPLLELRHTGAK